jgi:hypothetical protein
LFSAKKYSLFAVKNLAKEWIMRAVAINQSSTFEATDTLTIKHSSSVVDFFCFANEVPK